jgi:hypothetical protein
MKASDLEHWLSSFIADLISTDNHTKLYLYVLPPYLRHEC